MNELFSRNVPGSLDVLNARCVGVAGCGGLGSNAAVALTRAGIGRLIIADFDRVEPSNLNRQHFFMADLGRLKTSALKAHLVQINPHVKIVEKPCRLNRENVPGIFGEADILVEALDDAWEKQQIIQSWCQAFPHKPIVCGNGLSGIGDMDKIRVVQAGNIYFCGDMQSEMELGLCAAKVAVVANLQAEIVIELLMGRRIYDHHQ